MTEEISSDAVEAAWAFVSKSMASVEQLVKDAATGGGSAKPMKTPEELIRDVLKKHGGEANASDLLRPLWGKMNAAGIKDAVEGMDDVEMVKEKSAGRGAPKTIYRLVDPEGQNQLPEAKPKFTIITGEAPTPVPKAEPAMASINPFMQVL
jgi:hypothetical protein